MSKRKETKVNSEPNNIRIRKKMFNVDRLRLNMSDLSKNRDYYETLDDIIKVVIIDIAVLCFLVMVI